MKASCTAFIQPSVRQGYDVIPPLTHLYVRLGVFIKIKSFYYFCFVK